MAYVIVGASIIHGFGVFANRDFAENDVILSIDDSRIVDDVNPLRPEFDEHDYHCDYLANGKVVLMQSPERHINSSCAPNSYIKTINGGRKVVARRDIRSGEEITYDYIIDADGGGLWECHCGSPRCRRVMAASFFDLPLELQLEYLPLLNEWFIQEHLDQIKALRRQATET